jgi:hypothetical protein
VNEVMAFNGRLVSDASLGMFSIHCGYILRLFSQAVKIKESMENKHQRSGKGGSKLSYSSLQSCQTEFRHQPIAHDRSRHQRHDEGHQL